MRSVILRLLIVGIGVAGVAGCSGSSSATSSDLPPITPAASSTSAVTGPSPSASPSLNAKSQAYTDAEKAYRAYAAALAALRRRGGASPTEAQQYTRRGGRAFTFIENLAKQYQARGLHTLSDGTIRSVKPKSYKPAASTTTRGQVILTVCDQASKSGVVDATGKPILKIRKGDIRLFVNTVYLTQENSGWVVDYFTVVKVKTC